MARLVSSHAINALCSSDTTDDDTTEDDTTSDSDGTDAESEAQETAQTVPIENQVKKTDPVVQRLSFPVKRPSTLSTILEAIRTLGEKKGSSPTTIKNFIIRKYPYVNPSRFKAPFKRAFLKALADGVIERTKATASAQGLSGRVRVCSRKPRPKQKVTAGRKKAKTQEKQLPAVQHEDKPKPGPSKSWKVPKDRTKTDKQLAKAKEANTKKSAENTSGAAAPRTSKPQTANKTVAARDRPRKAPQNGVLASKPEQRQRVTRAAKRLNEVTA